MYWQKNKTDMKLNHNNMDETSNIPACELLRAIICIEIP